ncbi:MAG TPA: hypothetical protein PK605_13140 [Ignavibacteria bacterium]|nr:hypothetical protein [Ignavibacteria bacterium]HRE11935.1 hypothetical protein [Ignavibacteria bacterium]HRF66316.1 hypothetical protein [Ignavibacteria bacterium]HRJ05340.1 hypothetical protein [Ignavibacteria bacterium]
MKNGKKFLGYVLFFAVLIVISFLLHNDVAANNNNGALYFNSDVTSGSEVLQKIIWREDIYDPSLKANVNVIKIDDNYFAGISGPEKAVLGYLASTIGNECFADGSMQKVKCKILSALNLGYQCSEESKAFLKNWFREDALIVSQIENCKPTLASTVEKTFDEVKISSEDNVIKVQLKGLKLNIKENTAGKWSESISFKVDGDKVSLTERKKKND